MSRAGFHFQSRLRRSFRAWPHGMADSWGFASLIGSLHPRLLCGAPSALWGHICWAAFKCGVGVPVRSEIGPYPEKGTDPASKE
jgi:hypothetical protein